MKYNWVKKTDSARLIVFYTGWGMSELSVNLKLEDYDFLVFYEYTAIDIPINVIKQIEKYKTIFVISWSLGILPAVANKLSFRHDTLIAINGSLLPVSDEFGISEIIYQGTYDNLNEDTLERFYRRMFYSRDEYVRFMNMSEKKKNIEQLRQELMFIKDIKLLLKDKKKVDKVIISKKDKIFPVQNLMSFWEDYILLEESHYPFFSFESWEEIINV